MIQSKYRDIPLDLLVPYYQSVRPIDWSKQFDRLGPLDVEIGFGLGEFLIQTARENPQRNFVGIELEWARVKKALRKIELQRKSSTTEHALKNIRFLKIDAVMAFQRLFMPLMIHKIYCLFPCPWPKKKHTRHRLFFHENLKLINNRLVDGGEVQIVTDYYPYFNWVFEQIDGTGFDVKTSVLQPQFKTKFEKKWCEAGQKEFFELKLTKKKHFDVAVEEDAELKVFFLEEFDPEHFHFSDVTGDPSIIFKGFLFDEKQSRGMIHLIVSEKSITQHVWLELVLCSKGWRLAKAAGHPVLPTTGVAEAVDLTFQAMKKTSQGT